MLARSRARVIVVQEVIPHYRLKLFELLHDRLAHAGVELKVVYGKPNEEQAAKQDLVDLPPSFGLKVRNLWLSDRMLYQPVIGNLLRADLAIFPNAAAYLPNYFFWLRKKRKCPQLGFWVYHTRQRAADRSLKEAVSRRMMRRGDWWFAYTDSTRDYLLANGAAEDRITVLNNSVDVAAFRASLAAVDAADLQAFSSRHGIPAGAPAGLFCGGLHRSKRLDFLFEALRWIHEQQPDFQLLVIGDGTCRDIVARAAAHDRRIHYLGASFGRDKALCFRLAQLFLCPGLVGLAILDAFAAGLPLVTTESWIHSPEIDYLHDGVNGLMTEDDARAYAAAVLGLLQSETQRRTLARAALDDAGHYSIDNMAGRFFEGIQRSLASRGCAEVEVP
ncbi:glycosyltransferase family 4 protein [Aquabacterium sp. A7-Y]|uniref:glycosyltransferase family 4 protein n=1 Tax=Aquabacterium sp. A7-Y TaxID=1349605 RepID=UPI00223E441D|nr:glycosyltransferase family 4 protein [Aquabacterium sp. A7-Y]MCW7538559.1 glycosyltransferase family 4 protein [Aquabacterium sp. A7-Y]